MKSDQTILMKRLFIFSFVLMLGDANFLNTAVEWIDNKVFNCRFNLCCNEFRFDSAALAHELKEKVHGQHLVVKNLVHILGGHFYNNDPSHALVLSFHGWTGCGKNFVSQIIARHVFKNVETSKHVHLFMPTHHFPHKSQIERYKDDLASIIRSHVQRCPRAVFIFDEIDKMPIGLIDVIRPFLERLPSLDGVDYRKSTFIFLSNTGGAAINQITLDHLRKGEKRETLSLAVMEQALSDSAYNEQEGGLWHTSLIELNLISAFIPFLPLTKEHVALCIHDEFKRHRRAADAEKVQKIFNELQFWPDDQIFSKSGCKRISQKVETLLFSSHMRNEL